MKIMVHIVVSLCLSSFAFANNYSVLQMKDVEEISNLVHQRIRESKMAILRAQSKGRGEEGRQQAVHILRRTLLTVLSRPNKDNVVAKVITPLRRELNNYNGYIQTIDDLIDISVNGLGDKSKNIQFRATYIVVLENIMAELQPQIKTNKSIQSLYEKIYKKKIKIPRDVAADRLVRSMLTSTSPSKTAHMILRKNFPKKYQKKRPWWKFW